MYLSVAAAVLSLGGALERSSDTRAMAALADRLVPQLWAGLHPEDMDDYSAGIDRVVEYGGSLLPALECVAASPDPERRAMAAELAGLLPSAGPFSGVGDPLTPAEIARGVRLLTRFVADADASVRLIACDSFGAYRHYAAAATPVLTSLLDDPEVDGFAIKALGAIGPAAKSAAPRVFAALKRERNDPAAPYFRQTALKALGRMEADTSEHVPFLTDLLDDPVNATAAAAAEALAGYTRLPPATTAKLRDMAAKPLRFWTTVPAKLALARGANDAEAGAFLIDLAAGKIDTPDASGKQSSAIYAIARLPRHAAKVRPVLQDLLRNELLGQHAYSALADLDAAMEVIDRP